MLDERTLQLLKAVDARQVADALGLSSKGSGTGKRYFCPGWQNDGPKHKSPDLSRYSLWRRRTAHPLKAQAPRQPLAVCRLPGQSRRLLW